VLAAHHRVGVRDKPELQEQDHSIDLEVVVVEEAVADILTKEVHPSAAQAASAVILE
jgi:hypothetical protein